MKIIKLLVFLVVALLIAVDVNLVYADTGPVLPQAFYGYLTINGHPAPAGAIVEARGTGVRTGIQGNPIITTAPGVYGSFDGLGEKLLVQGNIADEAVLHFFVNNVETDQTAVFQSGAVTQLYLSVAMTTADVNIRVVLQGQARPDAGWAVPLTVKFFTSGDNTQVDVFTATPVSMFNLTTAKTGNTSEAQAVGIMPGTYDISVVSPHCLVNVKRNAAITAPYTVLDMGTLLEGNANDDNKVSILDFGLLAKTYGKQRGQSGFDDVADFDRNDKISILDFGLLAANYGKYAPVEVH